MKFICDKKECGVRILRCFGYDGQVEIPEKISGYPVIELGDYLFAETVRKQKKAGSSDAGCLYLAEEEDGENLNQWRWERCQTDLLFQEYIKEEIPVIKGSRLQAVSLPKTMKTIGAYAFYHCENLNYLQFFSSILDLGAGLFTGCYGVNKLDIWMVPEEKSCVKEVLAELRQTLRVNFLDKQGEPSAKLLFPEYFEESIENTPARILTQKMHGCGHRYRNAFSGTDFQYAVYDKLFPHIQVQEDTKLVMELVMGRLMFPVQLQKERREIYEEYAKNHGREIVCTAVKEEDMEILRFAGRADWCTKECMEDMLREAGSLEDAQVTSILMDIRQKRFSGENHLKKETAGKRKKRFAL